MKAEQVQTVECLDYDKLWGHPIDDATPVARREPAEYNYKVVRYVQDGEFVEFVGVVEQFPSLSASGNSEDEALADIQSLVAFVVNDLKAESATNQN